MARFENEGYCPFNAVSEVLGEMETGYFLRGLWSLVGPSVVYEEDIVITDTNAIFTKDPVADRLLRELCKMWTGTEKIHVSAPQENAYAANMQSLVDLNAYCAREGNQMIVAAGSMYSVVVRREEEIIHVFVWELDRTL